MLYATQQERCASNAVAPCAKSLSTEEADRWRKEMTGSSIVRVGSNNQRRAMRKSRQKWSFPRDLEPLLNPMQQKPSVQSCNQLRKLTTSKNCAPLSYLQPEIQSFDWRAYTVATFQKLKS